MSRPRNATAGHNFEREIVNELKSMGYEAYTARYASRLADDRGIDVVTDFPFKIQAKCSIKQPNFHLLLTERECDAVFFRKQEKANTRFVTKGEYVVITKEAFYKLVGDK